MTNRPFGLFGVTIIATMLFVSMTPALTAQTLNTLATFDGANGSDPEFSTVVQGLDGNFYGTTTLGGANDEGTFFQVTPDGTLTTLYDFCSLANCTDGYNPISGVILGTDGNFYGTTEAGGTGGTGYTVSPDGTVFKITSTGELTTLYSFCSQDPNVCTDGAHPRGGLIQAADGNFYGITTNGGSVQPYGGTVFRITPTGELTTIYNFCSQPNCIDGSDANGESQAGLIQGTDGNFYGTTDIGGAYNSGTVFKLESTFPFTETVLYSFCSKKNCTDGAIPEAGLVRATDGEFYGATVVRGSAADAGTIFKISSSGALKTLYYPNASLIGGLIQATDRNLYSTTSGGGANGAGTFFKMTLAGAVTPIYNFCSLGRPDCADGASPWATPFQGTDGNFYGTTQMGGASGGGTVYSLSTGLAPFVQLYPTSGANGASVTILGTNLSGATKVRFDGTKATFTIVSDSEITTTVPTGAKTGKVTVITPSGTLKSNVSFQVTE